MRLRPFFTFYGGKHRTARLYPAPEHGVVIEPFAGSAGYATMHHDRAVTLIEKDETIAALWLYLTHVTAAEIRRLPLLESDGTVDDISGPAEARSLVGFWLNKGASAPRRSPSKWMRDGIRPNSFWGEAVRERIASQVEHVRHWRVIVGDYSTAPDIEATWFVDPPYEYAGLHYRCSMAGDDFSRLAAWTLDRRGLVVACEQVGATWLPFEPFVMAKANESASGGKRSPEAIYVQGSRLIGLNTQQVAA